MLCFGYVVYFSACVASSSYIYTVADLKRDQSRAGLRHVRTVWPNSATDLRETLFWREKITCGLNQSNQINQNLFVQTYHTYM